MSKQKLELTWIGKEKRPKLEPRILLEDPEKSFHATHRFSDSDIFNNRLIFGDNLLESLPARQPVSVRRNEKMYSNPKKVKFNFEKCENNVNQLPS